MTKLMEYSNERERLSREGVADLFTRPLHKGHKTRIEKNAAGNYYEVDEETGEVINGEGPLPDKPEEPEPTPTPGEAEKKVADEAAEAVKEATATLQAATATLEGLG
eukprot:CAMPEP_0205909762 /NCGR_PEP_ID=MMETSP1325-20131115/4077_1 /ASSEMBLY_ACC=CAM_ASM_000708 /TAXON_ID=236786 /ORGANISM="Florenciella sp., Strain RCC1007" /LENGTH=106 /DNA_ID=CAMNT_0053276083 /DNA_START=12 /DNA_END=328 /DNA_ORIENTATION=+